MSGEISLTLAQARRAWTERQSLTTASRARHLPLASLVASIAWIPITSSASPYLSLFARGAIARRSDLDEAIFTRGELTVAPGPRGLSWIVPTADAPIARAFAMADHTSRESRVSSTCGLTARDLQAARDALRKALEQPRTPAALQASLPASVLRNLGTPGRRAGVATLAGLALRALWAQGEVTRTLLDARLDRERYQYSLTQLPKVVPSAAEAVAAVALRWLTAHAPASTRAFADAFDLATGRALAALKPLRPVTVRVETLADPLFAPADFAPPTEADNMPRAALLPAGDPYLDARPDLDAICAPEVARGPERKRLSASSLALVDGEVVGLWTLDRGRISIAPLVALSPQASASLEEQLVAVTAFIADELAEPTPRPARDAHLVAGEFTVEL